jgi:hypothetical protein
MGPSGRLSEWNSQLRCHQVVDQAGLSYDILNDSTGRYNLVSDRLENIGNPIGLHATGSTCAISEVQASAAWTGPPFDDGTVLNKQVSDGHLVDAPQDLFQADRRRLIGSPGGVDCSDQSLLVEALIGLLQGADGFHQLTLGQRVDVNRKRSTDQFPESRGQRAHQSVRHFLLASNEDDVNPDVAAEDRKGLGGLTPQSMPNLLGVPTVAAFVEAVPTPAVRFADDLGLQDPMVEDLVCV